MDDRKKDQSIQSHANFDGDSATGDRTQIRQDQQNQQPPQIDPSLADAQARLSESERERKVHLIKRILADDRKVRSFTEPWMDHVRRFLGVATPGSNLRSTYSAAGF